MFVWIMSHGHNRVHRLRARLPATDFLFEHNTPGAKPKKKRRKQKLLIYWMKYLIGNNFVVALNNSKNSFFNIFLIQWFVWRWIAIWNHFHYLRKKYSFLKNNYAIWTIDNYNRQFGQNEVKFWLKINFKWKIRWISMENW